MVAVFPNSQQSQKPSLPWLIEGRPVLSGWEAEIEAVTRSNKPVFLPNSNLKLDEITAGFAIALHMHQPTIPAGPNGEPISNLQYMFEHPYDGDNHNAGPFAYCYARMGDFIPELVAQGCNPRVMLDYSGTLLWGFQQMRRDDIFDKLRTLTCNPQYQPYVEWLGTFWSHSVAASTPLPDIPLQIRAWQHHFASLFGLDALARVKGFSPPEMQLPNNPDTLYTLVKALKDCGYQWMMVQEHTVETLDGEGIRRPHWPHRLIARNSHGEEASITVLIKTQGSDTKLIGQMQPYYEAQTRSRDQLGGVSVPPLVSQISDGENGGVMMNEFPGAFKRAWHEQRQQGNRGTVGVNGTEYLELLAAAGVQDSDFPTCQAKGQQQLWEAVGDSAEPERVEGAIAQLNARDDFSMDGASWTNDRSWVAGYNNVLQPMEKLSARFHEVLASQPTHASLTQQPAYNEALLYNLLLQTSCFRYWGQGTWTDYAQAFYQKGLACLKSGLG